MKIRSRQVLSANRKTGPTAVQLRLNTARNEEPGGRGRPRSQE
jgi:hypothetical protein